MRHPDGYLSLFSSRRSARQGEVEMPPFIPIVGGFLLGWITSRILQEPESKPPLVKSVAKTTIRATSAVSKAVDRATRGIRGFAAGIKEDLQDAKAEVRAEETSRPNAN